MSSSVSNGKRPVVTKKTGHVAVATQPDVCIVPGAGPQPFNNWVESRRIKRGTSETVLIDDARVCLSTTEWGPPSDPGHAGTGGGVESHAYRGYAIAESYSQDVCMEGRPIVRKGDRTKHNIGSGVHNTIGEVVDADELWAELEKKYNRIPERWCGLLAGSNPYSKRAIDALPKVTDHINKLAADARVPFTVTQEELAANMLGEGLDQTIARPWPDDRVNMWGTSGVLARLRTDGTFTEDTSNPKGRNAPWSNWMHPSVGEFARSGAVSQGDREKNDITQLPMEQALYTGAGRYAASKAQFARDLAALPNPIDINSLPRRAQLYWTGIYYNGGHGGGRSQLKKHGVDRYKKPVGPNDIRRVDVPAKGNQPAGFYYETTNHYNVQKRVAGYELLVKTCGRGSPQ